jgi:hypothetical protein
VTLAENMGNFHHRKVAGPALGKKKDPASRIFNFGSGDPL